MCVCLFGLFVPFVYFTCIYAFLDSFPFRPLQSSLFHRRGPCCLIYIMCKKREYPQLSLSDGYLNILPLPAILVKPNFLQIIQPKQ